MPQYPNIVTAEWALKWWGVEVVDTNPNPPKQILAEYAKSFYGFTIGTPSSYVPEQMPAPQRIQVLASGGGTLPLDKDDDPNDLDDTPPQQNKDLF